jgi:hypothetical protein
MVVLLAGEGVTGDHSFYGIEDVNYTLGTVAPHVVLWNWAAHLKNADPAALQRYEIRCYSHCQDTWQMRLVMLRRDQAGALHEAFADWPEVEIRDGIPSLKEIRDGVPSLK